MRREVVQQFGKDAMRVTGRSPTVRSHELLARLHDHLARRTVENPDLHHRAARQGLAGNIAEMEEHGFTVLERAISDEFADEVREHDAAARCRSTASRRCNWMLYQGRRVRAARPARRS